MEVLFRLKFRVSAFLNHFKAALRIRVAVFVRLFPVSKLIDDLRIRLLLNPSLEVSHDILIIQTAQVRDLPQDPLVLLGSVGEFDFLDGVDVTVETMASLVDYAKTAATEFLQLFKVVSVP